MDRTASAPTQPSPVAPVAGATAKPAEQHAGFNTTALTGVGLGLIAHAVWGTSPIYFKEVKHVDVWELLAHRAVWAAPMLLVCVLAFRRLGALRAALTHGPTLRTLAVTTGLIMINWFLYMYAIDQGKILHASMGYFYGPLVNIVLARLFLGETMMPATKIAVGLALVSMTLMAIDLGTLPWISIVLPLSFGFYALLRKRAPIDPLTGLTVEAWALVLPSSIFLLWAHSAGGEGFGAFGSDLRTSLLLPIAGLVTVIPLLTYNASAKRLSLTAVGFMQYLAPTGQLLLGWLVYDEAMSPLRGAAFIVVWIGLSLYTFAQVRKARMARKRTRWTVPPEA